MSDLKEVNDLLIKRGKARGKPIGISLFRDEIPEGYEPIQDVPCSIVRYARDEGRKVYFDADHHDCLVGVHHAGIVPGKREIVSGEYLSITSSFFTYDAAARLKASTPVLPTGMVKAIGAAPLDEIPEGVKVDWIIVVCDPQHANMISTCRLAREGIDVYGSFGKSLCGEIFAMPWHIKNIIVTCGDQGGRMHNKIKKDELFVIIPVEFVDYLPFTLEGLKVDVKASRRMTKPAHSSFWQEKKATTPEEDQKEYEKEDDEAGEVKFTMPWNEDASSLLKNIPEGIVEMVVENSEDFARDKGYSEVSRKSMDEQMAVMGTSIDEMMDSL